MADVAFGAKKVCLGLHERYYQLSEHECGSLFTRNWLASQYL